ncbi:MAG: glycosyltransferase family 39 protein, partial [bacterium]|nr:glycosyltransferase family 39 protein [bacterium]
KDFQVDDRSISFVDSSFHPDANALQSATKSLHTGIYPTAERNGQTYLFSTYGPVFMYLYQATASLGGITLGFIPFGSSVQDANTTRLSGRVLSALIGLLTVALTWVLGKHAYNNTTGLLAAFLLSITPMAIQAAHFATVDGLLALCAVWVGIQSIQILHTGKKRAYLWAGVAVGLAMATKLNGLLLATAVAIAHLLRPKRKIRSALTDPAPWQSAACALLTYIVLTPAALFRFHDYFFARFTGNLFHVFWMNFKSEGFIQRGSFYLENTTPYLYHLTDVFPGGLGWPLLLSVLLGIACACYHRRPEDLILVLTSTVYFLIVGLFYDKPIRYFVILGPFFALLAARLLTLRTRGLTLGIAVAVCAYTLAYATAFVSIYTRPDSRVQAARWIHRHTPEKAAVLFERGHNSLAGLISNTRNTHLFMDIEQELYTAQNDSLSQNGDYLACLEAEYLSKTDYLLLSDDRLPLAKARLAAKRYYQALFDGTLGFTHVKTFAMKPTLFGIVLDDTHTDLNGRRYDHPTTYIFRRTGEPALYAERPDLQTYRLQTWTDCWEILHRAINLRDYTLFKRCIPRKVRTNVSEIDLIRHFKKFLAQPQIVHTRRLKSAFFEEEGTWRLNLVVEDKTHRE